MNSRLLKTFQDTASRTVEDQREAKLRELSAPLRAVLDKIGEVTQYKYGEDIFGFTENVFPQTVMGENSMTTVVALYSKYDRYPLTVSGASSQIEREPALKLAYFTVNADGSASVTMRDQAVYAEGSHMDIKMPTIEVENVLDLLPHLADFVEKWMPDAVRDIAPKPPKRTGGLHVMI